MTRIEIYDDSNDLLLKMVKDEYGVDDPCSADIADFIEDLLEKHYKDTQCSGECDYCMYKSIVPGTDERIDREPRYYCSLYEKM